jgi:hypothetical protein
MFDRKGSFFHHMEEHLATVLEFASKVKQYVDDKEYEYLEDYFTDYHHVAREALAELNRLIHMLITNHATSHICSKALTRIGIMQKLLEAIASNVNHKIRQNYAHYFNELHKQSLAILDAYRDLNLNHQKLTI